MKEEELKHLETLYDYNDSSKRYFLPNITIPHDFELLVPNVIKCDADGSKHSCPVGNCLDFFDNSPLYCDRSFTRADRLEKAGETIHGGSHHYQLSDYPGMAVDF